MQNGRHDDRHLLRQIGQIRIQVTEVDRAVAFYRDALGMSFLYAFPGMAFFRDPDGNVLALMSEVPTE